ncbi:DUF932 [Desulfonema limicola]|uniref:DUF932 n=1 Tax=Desulfonema limicola TaxID=45656 RepID=A0A975GIM2_9BACT|nr:DUF932 domain-containing protein [Desulfonema limicola]QTA82755.1 DUF932 [Desulfonema limicola]
MRGNDTLINVIEMVEGISENHHDQIIPLADIEFENLDKAHVCGREIEVLPSAQRLLANRLHIPHNYLVRCPQELQERNLNFWLRQEQKNRDTFFMRFDGFKLRAVFTQRYTAFDNKDVLTQMMEYGFSLDTEIQYTLDDSLMNLKIPEYDKMFSFPGDDNMVPGTSIANSEIGFLAFSVEAYIYRLVCSNGLISKTSIGKRFKHISDKAMIEFEEIISQVSYESQHNQNRLRISTETSVEDADESFDSFNRRFLITKKEAEAVNIAWNREPGNTMFNIINAYTRGAQHPGLTAEESYKLERTGGQILALVK